MLSWMRVDKQRHLKSAHVAAGAARTALDDVATDLPEGTRLTAPTGQVLTVDYIDSGHVFFVEANAVEAPVGLVRRWARAGGTA